MFCVCTLLHNYREPSAAAGFDIFGLASAVSSTVKARAGEFVRSVQETDWKSELTAFSKEVSDDAKTVQAKTVEAVEHFPDVIEHLPEQVGTWEGGLPPPPRVLPVPSVTC